MTLLARLGARPATWLVRLACYLALAALAVMVYSIVNPRPLPVIFAMSAGHVIGAFAFACYFVSVLLDIRGASSGTSSRNSSARSRKIDAPDSSESASTARRDD
jgi:hypothetical protein